MDFQTFQSLTFASNRLCYSLYQSSDLNEVHALLSSPQVDQYNTLGVMQSVDDTEACMSASIKNHLEDSISNFTVVVRLKENNEFVGLAGLGLQKAIYRAGEVWYKLMPSLWGNGYATEILNWELDFAFNHLKLHRISAGCAVENIASYKVMEKVGMRKEGLSVKALPLEEGWVDTYEYAILAEEYLSTPKQEQ